MLRGGNAGLQLSADWSWALLRTAVKKAKIVEVGADFLTDFGNFHLAYSPLVDKAGKETGAEPSGWHGF